MERDDETVWFSDHKRLLKTKTNFTVIYYKKNMDFLFRTLTADDVRSIK